MDLDKEMLERLKEHEQVSKEEVEKTLFGGKSKIDTLGHADDDPATDAQIRFLFVLGRELGLPKKEEIKEAYGIDSIGDLTFGEIKRVLDMMQADLGENKDDTVKHQTQKEKNMKWTRDAGIDHVGSKFAKCGHCINFTGENTLVDGSCLLGNRKGSFKGNVVHPMLKDCFVFKHGELIPEREEKKEERLYPSEIDDDDSPF